MTGRIIQYDFKEYQDPNPQAVFEEMDYTRRMKSFETYEDNFRINVYDLATIGLFHSGNHNHVQCYMCGGLFEDLTNAVTVCNVWCLHSNLYPSCALVVQRNKKLKYYSNIVRIHYPM